MSLTAIISEPNGLKMLTEKLAGSKSHVQVFFFAVFIQIVISYLHIVETECISLDLLQVVVEMFRCILICLNEMFQSHSNI